MGVVDCKHVATGIQRSGDGCKYRPKSTFATDFWKKWRFVAMEELGNANTKSISGFLVVSVGQVCYKCVIIGVSLLIVKAGLLC